jgi:hypothetical protein
MADTSAAMQAAQQSLVNALRSNAAALEQLYVNPRPNYSLDGRSYSWTELRKSLLEEQKSLLDQIQRLDGPFEVVSFGGG